MTDGLTRHARHLSDRRPGGLLQDSAGWGGVLELGEGEEGLQDRGEVRE